MTTTQIVTVFSVTAKTKGYGVFYEVILAPLDGDASLPRNGYVYVNDYNKSKAGFAQLNEIITTKGDMLSGNSTKYNATYKVVNNFIELLEFLSVTDEEVVAKQATIKAEKEAKEAVEREAFFAKSKADDEARKVKQANEDALKAFKEANQSIDVDYRLVAKNFALKTSLTDLYSFAEEIANFMQLEDKTDLQAFLSLSDVAKLAVYNTVAEVKSEVMLVKFAKRYNYQGLFSGHRRGIHIFLISKSNTVDEIFAKLKVTKSFAKNTKAYYEG